jgi:BMFP domain-containing protein YqiC
MGRIMLDPKIFDEISKRLADSIPPGMQSLQDDLQRNLHTAMEAALGKLNLVTRDEFDIQQAVLQRTRQKLEQLEEQLQALEMQQEKAQNKN